MPAAFGSCGRENFELAKFRPSTVSGEGRCALSQGTTSRVKATRKTATKTTKQTTTSKKMRDSHAAGTYKWSKVRSSQCASDRLFGLSRRGRGVGLGRSAGKRAGRTEDGYYILGRRLWDALSLINSYYEINDFGPLAVPGEVRPRLITYLLPIYFLFISYSITYFIFVTFSILPIYSVAFFNTLDSLFLKGK